MSLRVPPELGSPAFVWDGAQVIAYRQPCVYLWVRESVCLYVGMSTNGVVRPLSPAHHRLTECQPEDQVIVYRVPTAEAAVTWENRLIRLLQPKYNGRGGASEPVSRGLTNKVLLAEATMLRARLRAIDEQMAGLRSKDAEQQLRKRKREDDADQRFQFDCDHPAALNVRSAAVAAGVSEQALRKAIRKGTIRFMRFGSYVRFLPEWVEEWRLRRPLEVDSDATTQRDGSDLSA